MRFRVLWPGGSSELVRDVSVPVSHPWAPEALSTWRLRLVSVQVFFAPHFQHALQCCRRGSSGFGLGRTEVSAVLYAEMGAAMARSGLLGCWVSREA